MSEGTKKDIVSQYAYRTFWVAMRVPVFLRLPFVAVATGCLAVKMVEHTIEHVKEQRARPDMAAASSENASPFAGAFEED